MKLVSLTIKNILGVSELTFNPEAGNVIEISGGNGKGKTSTLEAIKDVFGASSYSTLIRNGEDSGEVVLDYGDLVVNRKHKAGSTPKTTVKARLPGTDSFGSVGSPAKYIKGLVNISSLDPARLLSAKPKELVEVVLNSMPIQADVQRLLDITGVSHNTEGHALNVITNVGKLIFDERTGVNREAKQLKGTIDSLRETLPEDIPSKADIEGKIAQLQNDNLDIHGSFNEARAKVDEEAKGKAANCEAELKNIGTEIEAVDSSIIVNREETNAKIAELQKQIDTLNNEHNLFACKKSAYRSLLEQKASGVRARHALIEEEREEKQIEIDSRVVTKQQENDAQINALQKEMSQCAVYDNTLSNIKNYEGQLQQLTGKSKGMGEQLTMLNEYKAELCSALPIEGLEVKEGNLLLNGVSFETLNSAARLGLVVKLAELNAGDCGLVILDNTEMMDSDTYASFLAEADKTDITFIVARVTDGDLSLTTK